MGRSIRAQARRASEAFGLASHVRGERWENWGELPFGHDAGFLGTLPAPLATARIRHEFSRDLDAAAGRAGELVALGRQMQACRRGDHRRTTLRQCGHLICISLVRVGSVSQPDPAQPPAVGRGSAEQAGTAAGCRNRLVGTVDAVSEVGFAARVTSSASHWRGVGPAGGRRGTGRGCSSNRVRARRRARGSP